MFDALGPSERRQILLASRIRFTPEVQVPRQRALEKMVENALFVGMPGEWFTAQDVLDAFKYIGGLRTLRLTEIGSCLKHLTETGRVEEKASDGKKQYILSKKALLDIEDDFRAASLLLERVLNVLYKDLHEDPMSLAPLFLEIACDAFLFRAGFVGQ